MRAHNCVAWWHALWEEQLSEVGIGDDATIQHRGGGDALTNAQMLEDVQRALFLTEARVASALGVCVCVCGTPCVRALRTK